MPSRFGSPPSHLHVLHGAPTETPQSIRARGLLYGLASAVTAANATAGAGLAVASAFASPSLQSMQVVAVKVPLWGAAVALLLFHSPAALTLIAPTLALVQVGEFMLSVRQGDPWRLGVALLFAISNSAVSIPLLAEQALKRKRWLRAIRARGQLPRP